MGLDATITIVPRNKVRKKCRAAGLATFELYRDWPELQSALDRIGGPARLALRGNRPAPGVDEMDLYAALVTPAVVKRVSAALARVSGPQLLAAVHEARRETGWRLRKYEHKDILAAFARLKAAYRAAAREDAYLDILIC